MDGSTLAKIQGFTGGEKKASPGPPPQGDSEVDKTAPSIMHIPFIGVETDLEWG